MKHKTSFWIGIVLIVLGHIGVLATLTNPEERTIGSAFMIVVFFGGGVFLAVKNSEMVPRYRPPLPPQPHPAPAPSPPPVSSQEPKKATTIESFGSPEPKDGLVLWDSRVAYETDYDHPNIYVSEDLRSSLFLKFGEPYVGIGYARLARESDNYYDSEAIALWFKGEPIGYLRTERRAYAAKLLKRNLHKCFYLPALIGIQPFYNYDDDGVASDFSVSIWAFSNKEDWCKFTLRLAEELDVGIMTF